MRTLPFIPNPPQPVTRMTSVPSVSSMEKCVPARFACQRYSFSCRMSCAFVPHQYERCIVPTTRPHSSVACERCVFQPLYENRKVFPPASPSALRQLRRVNMRNVPTFPPCSLKSSRVPLQKDGFLMWSSWPASMPDIVPHEGH